MTNNVFHIDVGLNILQNQFFAILFGYSSNFFYLFFFFFSHLTYLEAQSLIYVQWWGKCVMDMNQAMQFIATKCFMMLYWGKYLCCKWWMKSTSSNQGESWKFRREFEWLIYIPSGWLVLPISLQLAVSAVKVLLASDSLTRPYNFST